MARLDVPTWDDPAVASQIRGLRSGGPGTATVAWTATRSLVETGSAFIRMFAEALVLFRVLREHGDGFKLLLVLVSLASEAVPLLSFTDSVFSAGDSKRDTPFFCR
jgi:hypothetical protein